MDNDCLKKIFKNYLDNLYLYVYSIVKNKEKSLEILFNAFEKVFVIDFLIDHLLDINDKINKYIKIGIKSQNNQNVYLNNVDTEIDIPNKLYLLDINTYNLFDYIDNQIIIYIFVYGKTISEISSILNISESYLFERFKTIVRFLRINYLNVFKK